MSCHDYEGVMIVLSAGW